MSYCTWTDAQVYSEERSALMATRFAEVEALIPTVEAIFEGEVRGFVDVPISSGTAPNTFADARTICALRVCAMFLRKINSDEGNDGRQWYPGWLDQQADKLVANMKVPRGLPQDAAASHNPVATVPSDGLLDGERPAAIFKRANIASGSGHW